MSYLTLKEGAAPSTPASGDGTYYNSTVGEPRFINDNGVDVNLTPNRKYNWLQNSGFWFAQRQAPGTLTTYSATAGRAISADRWGITNENASVQYQRTDTSGAPETGLVGRYYGTFTKITNTGKIVLSQVVEGSNTNVLRGSTVRVQIYAKANTNTTWRLGLAQLTSAGTIDTIPATFVSAFGAAGTDPTLGTNLSYIAPKSSVTPDNGTVNGNAIDIAVTTAWQRFGVVFDVPSSAKNLVVLIWSNGQITNTTGTLSVSQVSLTDGMAIQDWAPFDYSEELIRCQRYYCKSFNVDTAPAQNAGLAGAMRGHVSVAGATANQPIGVRFPVAMRVAPTTTTFYNPSNADAFVRNTTAGTNATATAASTPAENGMDVFFTGLAAWTVAQAVAVHYSADADL